MEIYLKFAENKAIMEKRQGQQEESPCEKEPNPKAYIHGVESAALDDVFELLAWNQGIGFFSSEIGPSALFQAYKLIKNGEKQGKSREDICSALREKFGEKNPEMQVLNR